jgi:hypothetical protein
VLNVLYSILQLMPPEERLSASYLLVHFRFSAVEPSGAPVATRNHHYINYAFPGNNYMVILHFWSHVMLHGPKDPLKPVNNPPLPSPIVTLTIENTPSSIEEWDDDDKQKGPMAMIKQHTTKL